MITLHNVTKIVDNFTILDDISLVIKDGTKLGVVGASGAGKSSLLRTINGLLPPTSGAINVDDHIINELSEKELNKVRKDMGMIFQHFNLLEQRNVFDNIALSLKLNKVAKNKHEEIVSELLMLVGLSDKRHDYPKTLSGGEKQRVAIARALANKPKFLLCDEATSALDKNTSLEVLNLLHKINKELNVTIIFVSHDLDAVKYLCNEVVFMDKGQIIEEQETLALFTNPHHPLTKELINKKVYNLSLTKEGEVYQITYLDKLKDEALISDLIKKYAVTINILYGEVMLINQVEVGFLYVEIHGRDKEKVISDLKKKVEVIRYA